MIEAVLDASVVVAWFQPGRVPFSVHARRLRDAYRSGSLHVLAPTLIALELLNVAGRRWRWPEPALIRFAEAIDDLAFELHDPDLPAVARWTSRGLTAYDAAYVAVAESAGAPLITTDAEILEIAGSLAVHVTDHSLGDTKATE